ncbi:hypothetical protein K461DRAFT_280122 [Myriangium duriaei CBS 260.36]|uniref:Uncharacterized protein n=1 Tax=Myriangium duriaei CBS 260.36 TaxID=1168546 RepID=A0A9P4MIR9_9PEZI|nr:hypothetical protein K461DRAFT_280122 [Myriangium duriaei CBS 260.36]
MALETRLCIFFAASLISNKEVQGYQWHLRSRYTHAWQARAIDYCARISPRASGEMLCDHSKSLQLKKNSI